MSDRDKSVYEFVHSDRQWKREHRINHIKYMLTKAQSGKEREYWRQVLEVNEG